jgi:putative transposase
MLPPRLSAFDYIGCHRYFVTCCTFGRARVLHDRGVFEPVRLQILQSAAAYRFEVLAYVFMPDHLHLLVEGRHPDADFRLFMRNWRKRSSLSAPLLGMERLWQKGFFERVLRGDEGTDQVITYMLGNPVREGLVANAMDYPFLWAVSTHNTPP